MSDIPSYHKEFDVKNLRASHRHYKALGNELVQISGKTVALLLSRLVELETFLTQFAQPHEMMRLRELGQGCVANWREVTPEEKAIALRDVVKGQLVFKTFYAVERTPPGVRQVSVNQLEAWIFRLKNTDPYMAEIVQNVIHPQEVETD